MNVMIRQWALVGAVLLLSPVMLSGQELKLGETVPDFTVKTLDHGDLKLSDRCGDDKRHTIVVFSRANW